ncbi:sigma-70 family RNA polymerase sigma factor [Dactylosporangium sp. NPDC005572]|uniref:RNA polymerase sigma factor n=1 Tax=Dactylosporangium sp. NPDC005572 TaxID=3156889 RepID=UPI0033BD26F4
MARAAPAADRYERLYRAHYQDLLGYALRRVDPPEAAADVVAETFLVAWRRFADIPADRARAWLFGVARNVLANHGRAERRRAGLADQLRRELATVPAAAPDLPEHVTRAFDALPEADRELLRLVAWEGLTTDELAVALDCTPNAVRIRLHRARQRFGAALGEPIPTTDRGARA